MAKKWWQVYANDEEQRIFVGKDGQSGLVRKKQFTWRSIKALAEESGLTEKRTEEIIHKYLKNGEVVIHDSGDKFAYWERIKIAEENDEIKNDQKERMDKAAKR